MVAKSLDGSPETKTIDKILPDEMVLDIGEKTIKKKQWKTRYSRTSLEFPYKKLENSLDLDSLDFQV